GCASNPSRSEIQAMELSFQNLLHAEEEARRQPVTWGPPDHPPPPPKKPIINV
ncbi:hypothetical protein FRC17_008666, partial [Serendipita sp. 399]